jgi:hypothetical protein
MPTYRGEFVGTKLVKVESWSPNRVVLTGVPGDVVTINSNPSSYWLVNGRRPFPSYRPMELEKPFRVTVPESGRLELVARPPHVPLMLLAQALLLLMALFLYRCAVGSPAALPAGQT